MCSAWAAWWCLGLPDGMLGTAWPSMRQSFGAPIADLGLILLVVTGRLRRGQRLRRRPDPPVRRAHAAGPVRHLRQPWAALGFALAPGIWLVFTVAVLLGAAAGMMDGGLNTAIGMSGRPAAAEPAARRLRGGDGHRAAAGRRRLRAVGRLRGPAYFVLVVPGSGDRGLVAGAAAARAGASRPGAGPPRPRARGRPGGGSPRTPGDAWSRRRSTFVVTAGMIIFFVYTGVEVAAGGVGGELLPRASRPVRLGGRDRRVRFLGGPHRGAACWRCCPGPFRRPWSSGGERGRRAGHGGDLVAAGTPAT